jgi:putative PIG3 family NAD(P)H quinone oxidoreductase
MRAVTVSGPGGPDVLTFTDIPDPEPGPGQVIVRVAATAVNRADLLQRQGHYPPPPGAPEWPGLEVSGSVLRTGPDVSDWQVGDQVCALLSGGGYAEQVTVPAGQLLPVPDGIPLIDAAGLPEATCTVWNNVFMLAGLRPAETLLVHGGAGGIGTMAIQLGHQAGARIAVTASTAEKLAACADLGADILINYREQDFVAETRAATGGHGADVVLDSLGAAYLSRNVEVLATNGRLVIIGLQKGRTAQLDLAQVMSRRAAILATTLRSRPETEKAAIVASVRENVWPLLADGRIRPVIHTRLPLDQVAQAHQLMEDSAPIGKIVLTVDNG